MRTTVNLDDQLLKQAQKMTGITERNAIIHAGLQSLIQTEASKRLARLGGCAPNLEAPPRRRQGNPGPTR